MEQSQVIREAPSRQVLTDLEANDPIMHRQSQRLVAQVRLQYERAGRSVAPRVLFNPCRPVDRHPRGGPHSPWALWLEGDASNNYGRCGGVRMLKVEEGAILATPSADVEHRAVRAHPRDALRKPPVEEVVAEGPRLVHRVEGAVHRTGAAIDGVLILLPERPAVEPHAHSHRDFSCRVMRRGQHQVLSAPQPEVEQGQRLVDHQRMSHRRRLTARVVQRPRQAPRQDDPFAGGVHRLEERGDARRREQLRRADAHEPITRREQRGLMAL
mmetsp:Transcript_46367/g.115005  ORF Transcript_46367/g.115005 Transcript_46367/m.115005 type:complete len:270 (-) Transcript_46367:202-1011(-)